MKIYKVTENCGPWWDNGSTSFHNSNIWPFRSKKQAQAKYQEVKSKLSVGDMVVLSEWQTNSPAQIFNHLKTDGQAPDSLPHVADWINGLDSFTNQGRNLEGSILITVSHATYVNYATNFHGLEWGDGMEADLIDGSAMERTNRPFKKVLLWPEEIEDLEGTDLIEHIAKELERNDWKWVGFERRPCALDEIAEYLSIDFEHPYQVKDIDGDLLQGFWYLYRAEEYAKDHANSFGEGVSVYHGSEFLTQF
jgi:hypothetical protein